MSTAVTPRRVVVTILQGDDYASLRELEAAVDRAAPPPGASPRIGDDLLHAAEARDAFLAAAEERAVKVTLQVLGRTKWREILIAHPPREEHPLDGIYGYNVDDACGPIIEASIDAAGDANPNLMVPLRRDEFLDSLPDGDYQKLWRTADEWNRGESPDPKAEMSSFVTRIFGETSESPDRLG